MSFDPAFVFMLVLSEMTQLHVTEAWMLPIESAAEMSETNRKVLLHEADGQQMGIQSSSLHLARKQLQREVFCLWIEAAASLTRDDQGKMQIILCQKIILVNSLPLGTED